jgi:hypothetical protein
MKLCHMLEIVMLIILCQSAKDTYFLFVFYMYNLDLKKKKTMTSV